MNQEEEQLGLSRQSSNLTESSNDESSDKKKMIVLLAKFARYRR